MSVRVILLEPETGGNIGSVARSMKNFHLNDLWIVNPKTPINNEARAFSMKGLGILTSARVVRRLRTALRGVDLVVGTSAVAATSTSNLPRFSITPLAFAKRARTTKGKVALVFGRESSGLSNKEVGACDLMVTIPASRDYNVLNIGTAASIIFYELFQQRPTSQHQDLASQPAKDALLTQFKHLVRRSDVQKHKRSIALRAFRNVVSRAFVSRREASLLTGVFRKANSKLL